jgi:hypothetical protein
MVGNYIQGEGAICPVKTRGLLEVNIRLIFG